MNKSITCFTLGCFKVNLIWGFIIKFPLKDSNYSWDNYVAFALCIHAVFVLCHVISVWLVY